MSGFAEPIAYEGALKIKEITYIHAEGFSGDPQDIHTYPHERTDTYMREIDYERDTHTHDIYIRETVRRAL